MGRKILLAVACLLAVSKADTDAGVASAKLEDSVAEASLPRLYRSIPVGVYASASPYASFSFHVPTFASSPKIAHLGPIKQESVIVENKQGFLKDSYGNKFVESPHSLPYRTAFPQQYVQLQELPAHLAQPLVAAAPSFEYKQLSPHFFGPPQFKVQTVQAASPSANRYAVNQPYEFGPVRNRSPVQQQQQQHLTNNKSQRLEELHNPYNRDHEAVAPQATTNKGKNAEIKFDTKPAVPLLDLSLLEPLTFANPLVPQVQHFLPRISSVTYHKLPQLNVDGLKSKSKMKEIMIQKTKSYESEDLQSTPQKQQKPHPDVEHIREEQDPPNDSNSPNYKESYNEKFVNYNKEIESEPVHYSYDMKSDKEPLSYNYVRTTKEPYRDQAKDVNPNTKQNINEDAKHLIYKFTPEDSDDDTSDYDNPKRSQSENNSEERKEDKAPVRLTQQNKDKNYNEETHDSAEHREEEARSTPERIVNKNEEYHRKPAKLAHHNSPQKHSEVESLSVDNPNAHFQPILLEHEENIRIVPTPKKYATIKVDPNQHIQPQNHGTREPENNPDDPPHNQPQSHHRAQYHPEQLVEEKAKSIVITEETTQEPYANSKGVNDEASALDDKREDEFKSGYSHPAYGYPAYQSISKDTEKEIYNPEPYMPARYQSNFDNDSPFQRYVAESDEFPKSTRSNYKDARDNTKDRYYLDYSISKPESMLERLQQKEDYYKTYMHRKPQYFNNDDETDKNNEKKSAKYTAEPGLEYHASAPKPKQYFAKYKVAPRPQVYGYDYIKEAPKDNSAHASGPYQRLKTHTQFVEPQFQYGFEPSALPRLLDSELSAMASNNSPENEKPLMRKKVYKENWYIKKTSSNGRKATS